MDSESNEISKEVTFKGRGGRELKLDVYGRLLLFDLRLNDSLGEPAPDATPSSQLLHWNRIGVILAAEGLRPGREDLPARPNLGAEPAAWWAYADRLVDLFMEWGLTERAVLHLRKVSDSLTGWNEALEAEGKG